ETSGAVQVRSDVHCRVRRRCQVCFSPAASSRTPAHRERDIARRGCVRPHNKYTTGEGKAPGACAAGSAGYGTIFFSSRNRREDFLSRADSRSTSLVYPLGSTMLGQVTSSWAITHLPSVVVT